MYSIDRKTASKLLKVSTRTVDRYIMAGKLSTEKRDGRIWLDKKEIQGLRRRQSVDKVDSEMSIDKPISVPVDMSIDSVDVVSTSTGRSGASEKRNSSERVYEKLYEELRVEYKKQQERLEGANYRVGQLEALTRESVPLLDHQRLLSEEKAAKLDLEQGIESLRQRMEKLQEKIRNEKWMKKMYLILLFIFLLLQPLWLLLLR